MRSLPMVAMSVLMGVSAHKMGQVLDRVKESVARAQIRSIGKFISVNAIDDGVAPEKLQGVAFAEFLKHNMDGGRQRHLDPWGRPYTAFYTKQKLVIVSHGPDGRPNSSDDVRETILLRAIY